MTVPTPWPAGVQRHWLRDAAQWDVARQTYADTFWIDHGAALRANLSVAENIAWVPMYHQGMSRTQALAEAEVLLERTGQAAIAALRPGALSPPQRLATLFLQACSLQPSPAISLDRPALWWPDAPYPLCLRDWLQATEGLYPMCHVFDLACNAPLYP